MSCPGWLWIVWPARTIHGLRGLQLSSPPFTQALGLDFPLTNYETSINPGCSIWRMTTWGKNLMGSNTTWKRWRRWFTICPSEGWTSQWESRLRVTMKSLMSWKKVLERTRVDFSLIDCQVQNLSDKCHVIWFVLTISLFISWWRTAKPGHTLQMHASCSRICAHILVGDWLCS